MRHWEYNSEFAYVHGAMGVAAVFFVASLCLPTARAACNASAMREHAMQCGVLLHRHIPKSAGTAVRTVLKGGGAAGGQSPAIRPR
jgi:hypothetical protein